MRRKREALQAALRGRVRAQHRFVLAQLLGPIDSGEATISRFDTPISRAGNADPPRLDLLDTIPGVARETAEMVVTGIGTDRSRFPSAGHLAAWASLAPGSDGSAGKRRSGKTRKGAPWLRSGFVAAARSAVRSKNTDLTAQYHRLAARRGTRGLLWPSGIGYWSLSAMCSRGESPTASGAAFTSHGAIPKPGRNAWCDKSRNSTRQ